MITSYVEYEHKFYLSGTSSVPYPTVHSTPLAIDCESRAKQYLSSFWIKVAR